MSSLEAYSTHPSQPEYEIHHTCLDTSQYMTCSSQTNANELRMFCFRISDASECYCSCHCLYKLGDYVHICSLKFKNKKLGKQSLRTKGSLQASEYRASRRAAHWRSYITMTKFSSVFSKDLQRLRHILHASFKWDRTLLKSVSIY